MVGFEISEIFKIKKGVEVFLLNLEYNKNNLCHKNIPINQFKDIARYRWRKDREKRILARTFLYSLIASKYEIFDFDLLTNEFHKPYLKSGNNIEFSFSYSEEYVLIGVSSIGRIGVDIEIAKKSFDLEHLAKEIMCFDEWVHFNGLSGSPTLQKQFFFDLFSAKESIIKAFGTGLYYPVSKLNILKGNRYFFNQARFKQVRVQSSLDNFSISVCFEMNLNDS